MTFDPVQPGLDVHQSHARPAQDLGAVVPAVDLVGVAAQLGHDPFDTICRA